MRNPGRVNASHTNRNIERKFDPLRILDAEQSIRDRLRAIKSRTLLTDRANPKPLFLSDQYREWLTVVYQDNLSDLRSGGQPRPRGLR